MLPLAKLMNKISHNDHSPPVATPPKKKPWYFNFKTLQKLQQQTQL